MLKINISSFIGIITIVTWVMQAKIILLMYKLGHLFFFIYFVTKYLLFYILKY